MEANLCTTNLLLGIMAAVSVLEALLVIGMGVAGFMVYRRVMTLVRGLEERQVAPAMVRVDDTADRVRSNVRAKTSRVVGFVRGLRVALESVLHTRNQPMEGPS